MRKSLFLLALLFTTGCATVQPMELCSDFCEELKFDDYTMNKAACFCKK